MRVERLHPSLNAPALLRLGISRHQCSPDLLGQAVHQVAAGLREAGAMCSEVGFLKEGRLVARGTIPALQRRLGLGDRLALVFADGAAPLDYGRLPGVLAHTVDSARVDLVLDHAELRLADILEAVFRTGAKPIQVRVQEVDLEAIYREITH